MKEQKKDKMLFTDMDIAGVETDDDGKKYLHIYGYGYNNGDTSTEKHCRFVEYTFAIIPMAEILATGGVYKWDDEHAHEYKQYITDCTEDEMQRIYESYDNGRMPKVIEEKELSLDTPDGTYILSSVS